MQRATAHGGGANPGDAGASPQESTPLLLLAAIQRGEGADSVQSQLATLLPPQHRADWEHWLGHLLQAALDRLDGPGVLAALLAHGAAEPPPAVGGSGGGGGGSLAPAAGVPPMLQQLLASAVQRGNPGVVGVVLRHCGGDPDMPLPAFPSGMLAFSCYTGNLPLIASLLHWGADHQRALDLLSPPAAVGIRWDAAGVALLRRAQRAFLLHKLRLLREYASRPPRPSPRPSDERAASAVLDAMVGGGEGRRAALPAVELMPLEARLEEQLRIGVGGLGEQSAAPPPAPAPTVGRVLAVLEYTVDGMPLLAFRRLVRMMGDF